MKPFEIEVQHSAETVSDLTRAQYALSHKTARLIQVVTAVVCLLPCSVFVVGEKDFNVRPKGDGGKGETIAYAKCRHLLRYRHATYFFLNEQAAFIFPDGCIKGQSPAEFQAFLSSRTGKPCQTLYPWLSASLWSIIRQKKAG